MAVRLSGCLTVTASVFPHNKINIKYFLLISSELQEPSTLLCLPAVIIIVTITVKIILMNKPKQRVSASLLQPSTLCRLLLCQGPYKFPAPPGSSSLKELLVGSLRILPALGER